MRFDEMVSRPLSGITHVDLEELVKKDEASEPDTEKLKETLKLWGIMPITSDEGCIYFLSKWGRCLSKWGRQ
jgi:hypothetical protein